METVYIVAIVVLGVAVVSIVLMLRGRLKSAEGRASLKDREIGGKIEAFSPKTVTPPSASPSNQPSIDISGNVLLRSSVIRVWRNSVRVARNWLLGRETSIEVKEKPRQKGRR